MWSGSNFYFAHPHSKINPVLWSSPLQRLHIWTRPPCREQNVPFTISRDNPHSSSSILLRILRHWFHQELQSLEKYLVQQKLIKKAVYVLTAANLYGHFLLIYWMSWTKFQWPLVPSGWKIFCAGGLQSVLYAAMSLMCGPNRWS